MNKSFLYCIICFLIGFSVSTRFDYNRQKIQNNTAKSSESSTRSTPLANFVLTNEIYTAGEIDDIFNSNMKVVSGTGSDSIMSVNTNIIMVDLAKFGQTNNNQAVSESSIAIGYGTLAGQFGYRYSAIDYENRKIVFEVIPSGWEVGDIVSIINKSKYPNFGSIVSISSNEVTVSTWPSQMPTNIVEDVDNFDRQVAYVELKQNCGNIDIGQGSIALGINNKAFGMGSYVEGVGNTAAGQYSHVEGRSNYGQYMNHVEGQNNYSSGFWSHVEGRNNTNSATLAHVSGQNVNVSHANTYTWSAGGNTYYSKGTGTYAINPTDGANGFYIGNKKISDVIQDEYEVAISNKVNSEIDSKITSAGIPVFSVKTNSVGKIVSATFDSDGDENYGQFKMFLDIGGNLTIESLYGKELPENVGVIEVYSKETLDAILTNIVRRIETLENN